MFGYWLWGGYRGGYGGWGYGMMGLDFGMMGYPGYGMMRWGDFGLFGILGVVFGAIIIISAIMLNGKPQEHTMWGMLIVVFSVLSIFGGAMGGIRRRASSRSHWRCAGNSLEANSNQSLTALA